MDTISYALHIKNVLDRINNIFSDIKDNPYENELKLICDQLKFILHYAESGKSFKQGLLERKRENVRSRFEFYFSNDLELKDAIKTVYTDLDAHDYNVGTIDREMSSHLFDLITNKKLYYAEAANQKILAEEESNRSHMLADIFFSNLYGANYTKLWVMRGIKNIQYFFLINLFSYISLTYRAIENFMHPDVEVLVSDIERIHDFYTSLESEGTHMWLNPVELKEDGDQVYLVDLHGNIIEKGDNAIEI